MKQQKKNIFILFFVLGILVLICGFFIFNKNTSLENSNSGDNIIFSGDSFSNNMNSDNMNAGDINSSGENYKYISGNITIDGIKFSNYRVNPIGINKCEFIADVKNLTENYSKARNVRIKIINSSGDVEDIFAGILTELAPYEPNIFKTQLLSKIDESTIIEIEIVEK